MDDVSCEDISETKIMIQVKIFNRRDDCCSDRLNHAKVFVVNDGKETLCGGVGVMKDKSMAEVNCRGLVGSGVTIRIEGKKKILTLCEVQVFGTPGKFFLFNFKK